MDWWQNLDLAAKTAVGAAALGWIAALVTAAINLWANRSLERTKTDHMLSLEKRKSELQKELEDRKADIAADLTVRNARTTYEFDARKHLYEQIEPLLFQMYEAAESSFHGVTSLVRTQKIGELPRWLQQEGYYLRSIVHRLFLPLVLLRLIQRSTTIVDLKLDPTIHLRYLLAKQSYLTWTDDFGIAALNPKLPYQPNVTDWHTKRQTEVGEPIHWRQGLVLGHLDRLVEGMIIVDGTSRRPMSYGEFEAEVRAGRSFREHFEPVADVFFGASIKRRPVLARLLLVHATLMHVLMTVYNFQEHSNPAKIAEDFMAAQEKDGSLNWWNGEKPSVLYEVRDYVLKRIAQATTSGEYSKF